MSFDVFIYYENTYIQSCVFVVKTAAEKQDSEHSSNAEKKDSKHSSNAEKRIVSIVLLCLLSFFLHQSLQKHSLLYDKNWYLLFSNVTIALPSKLHITES